MNLLYIPMLFSGTLCSLLAAITWLLRRGESVNRTFAFFALALALDSFTYLLWFQYGSMEDIQLWMRIIMVIGTLSPIALILFFFAFTGYDQHPEEKVFWIKVKYFRIFALGIFALALVLSATTQLFITYPATPKDIWDNGMGLYGNIVMPGFAFIFLYMLAMAFKSYKRDNNKPRRQFILLLALGVVAWVMTGYFGIIFISTTGLKSAMFNYIGTSFMTIIHFLAIIKYQSDKERTLNRSLLEKVTRLEEEMTERERVEQLAREQQEKLIQSDKMASVGILVSGVAHEINNPNNYMMLNSGNLSDIWKDLKPMLDNRLEEKGDFMLSGIPYSEMGDDITEMIQALKEGPERIKKIVMTLKDFARKDPGNVDQTVEINAVIEASITILANLIKKSSDRFEVKMGAALPTIKGNFQQLEQVVINLLSNACQALADRSKAITITTSYNPDSRDVMIIVADEGKGIAQEDMKHIIDPFFTTKRDTGGTGLGLSISYKIIQDHNGELTFESEPGKGTTATIVLPVVGRQ